MEADIFWMRKAGQDPLAWFRKYPGRFHMLHVKDMGPPPANEMVDVGKGRHRLGAQFFCVARRRECATYSSSTMSPPIRWRASGRATTT